MLLGLTGYVEQWLWMRQLDYVGIFWTLLSVQWAMGILAFGLAFVFWWLNLRRAVHVDITSSAGDAPRRAALGSGDDAEAKDVIALLRRLAKSAAVLVSAGVALLFAFALFAQWDTYLRFRYGEHFGVVDPLYNVDVGFYIFQLPFYEMMPLYLTAAATNFPQLKRVIAIAGDKVVMEPTLDEALASLFGTHQPQTANAGIQPPTPAGLGTPADFTQARAQFDDFQKAAGHGDWTRFGDAIDELKALLANQTAPLHD